MISANELKVNGVKAISEGLMDSSEVAITVRGKVKYVAMTIEQFDAMRVAEIQAAYNEVVKDIGEGNFTKSLDKHFKEIDKNIDED